MEHYKIIIVGGGPIGLACGLEAKKAGLSYVILEKGALVNSLYNYPVNMTFFSTSERLEIGGIPFVSNNPKPTRAEALEYYRRVAITAGSNIKLFEEVTEVDKEDKSFRVTTNKSTYSADNIIICTGFYDIPYLLNVKGEELSKVRHYYKDPHFYAFQKVLVVGAANSAIDAALETWRKGAEVTMVIREDKISDRVKYWVKPDIENRIKEDSIKAYFNSTIKEIREDKISDRVKYWVKPDIENRIKEDSIKAYFNSTIKEIREDEVDVQTPAGMITIKNDWVIAMTGYQPNLSFLKNVGIELSNDEVRKPTYSEDTQETNVKGIYLAGVICGGMNTHRLFIENSREHAVKIVQHIVASERKS